MKNIYNYSIYRCDLFLNYISTARGKKIWPSSERSERCQPASTLYCPRLGLSLSFFLRSDDAEPSRAGIHNSASCRRRFIFISRFLIIYYTILFLTLFFLCSKRYIYIYVSRPCLWPSLKYMYTYMYLIHAYPLFLPIF